MLEPKTKLGPQTKRLISEYAATIMARRAKAQHGAAGVGEIASIMASDGADGLQSAMRQAFEQARDAIETIRRAPGSERWPTDEDIAAEIMRTIDARRDAFMMKWLAPRK